MAEPRLEGERPTEITPRLNLVRITPTALYVPTPMLSPCAPPWRTVYGPARPQGETTNTYSDP